VPYDITVHVLGSGASEIVISGPKVDTRAEAEADMAKIREAENLYRAERYDEARSPLPDWLIVDPGLIRAASISGSGK
jgi:hypothetical protein